MKLVIVESPAKAKTINKYLGNDYKVVASFGHVRQLPSKNGSVVPEKDFSMLYEVGSNSTKHVSEIVKNAKQAKEVLLASDPDREGEAIAWNIAEILQEKKAIKPESVHRVTFNEITKKAVLDAIKNPREIDMNLVNAQQARLALDYLVGFTLSPVLWKKLPGSRSAGRVQSVALRMIVEREIEIKQFVPEEYWTLKAKFITQKKESFIANLIQHNDKKIDKTYPVNQDQAQTIAEHFKAIGSFSVLSCDKKQVKKNPAPPLTTSLLQQEGSRRLGFTSKKTMTVAQKLYEGIEVGSETRGLITYMRTDGMTISEDALLEIRKEIIKQFGQDYLPDKANHYKTKAKNAQEAHEAIRPTDMALTPEIAKKYLDKDQLRLYELIWQRTMCCQMKPAVLEKNTVNITAKDKSLLFRAIGSVILFQGYLKVYDDKKNDNEQDINDETNEDDLILPPMQVNDPLDAKDIAPKQHFTQGPPRFTEASLIKRLEELGIGRPSTYATIISVLQEREYVKLEKKAFFPETKGIVVSIFLTEYFKKYVEYDFTAKVEEDLDLISNGAEKRIEFLRNFWDGFVANINQTMQQNNSSILSVITNDLGSYLFEKNKDGTLKNDCPSCGTGKLSIKTGKFGPFIGCSGYPECKFIEHFVQAGDDADASNTEDIKKEVELGEDPKTSNKISLKKGPYGYYVEEKNGDTVVKRSSIPKGNDISKINLEIALRFLSLPRVVGIHPETKEEIKASIGKFGPYLLYNKKFYNVKGDDIMTIGINKAVSIIEDHLSRAAKAKK